MGFNFDGRNKPRRPLITNPLSLRTPTSFLASLPIPVVCKEQWLCRRTREHFLTTLFPLTSTFSLTCKLDRVLRLQNEFRLPFTSTELQSELRFSVMYKFYIQLISPVIRFITNKRIFEIATINCEWLNQHIITHRLCTISLGPYYKLHFLNTIISENFKHSYFGIFTIVRKFS